MLAGVNMFAGGCNLTNFTVHGPHCHVRGMSAAHQKIQVGVHLNVTPFSLSLTNISLNVPRIQVACLSFLLSLFSLQENNIYCLDFHFSSPILFHLGL